MNNKVRSRVNNLIVVMTVIVFALSLIATAFFAFPADLSALTDINSATKIGGGKELYNKDRGNFNIGVVSDFIEKLFGDEDPVEYIKTNGAVDWNTYGKNSPSALKDDPYYVVPASVINNKIRNTNGLIVTLNGLDWMVASLTLADTDNGRDNVIATLYLANNQGTSQYYSDSNNTKGNNSYSRSIIRNDVLLNKDNTTWNMFSQGGADSFAEQYLVQPKNIKYQQTETIWGRKDGYYNMHNDALSELTSGWHSDISSDPYKPEDEFDGHRYDEWGNDYIWLPSLIETGSSNVVTTSSIWNLSDAQRRFSDDYIFLRSGNYGSYNAVMAFGNSTSDNAYGISISYTGSVCPAIHLNLSAVGVSFGLQDPEDVNTEYNAEYQTLGSILANDKEAADWYDSEWYEHNKEYVKLTYSNSEMSNIGEYWMKAEIQQNWIDDVRAAVDADATANGWTEEEKEQAYELRRPKFYGKPDT
ncbi:MAG: hypothetical protein HFK07_03190, partial [Clostridia bacterium]|nr:hypothetical protein [Clostridia bacterium]